MNLLLDDINELVKNRIKIDFNTDFRISIMFELLMQDPKYSIKSKTYQTLKLFYPNLEQVTDLEKALNNIIWFYSCDNKNKTSQNNENRKEKQIYSYEFDNELIYSAFKNQYNIDLEEIEYLHWWKFKAMFNGLKSDNRIVEIMGYRAMDLSKIKDEEERKRYKKLQRIYALPDMRTQEQKESDFACAFLSVITNKKE